MGPDRSVPQPLHDSAKADSTAAKTNAFLQAPAKDGFISMRSFVQQRIDVGQIGAFAIGKKPL